MSGSLLTMNLVGDAPQLTPLLPPRDTCPLPCSSCDRPTGLCYDAGNPLLKGSEEASGQSLSLVL